MESVIMADGKETHPPGQGRQLGRTVAQELALGILGYPVDNDRYHGESIHISIREGQGDLTSRSAASSVSSSLHRATAATSAHTSGHTMLSIRCLSSSPSLSGPSSGRPQSSLRVKSSSAATHPRPRRTRLEAAVRVARRLTVPSARRTRGTRPSGLDPG